MSQRPPIDCVGAGCAYILRSADPLRKAMAARSVARDWAKGRIAHRFDVTMPDRPARPEKPLLLPPNQMPRRGKMGSKRTRVAMLHALAHIEFVAIDLAFDLLGRFGGQFPRAFTDDWIRADAATHHAG